LVFTSLTKEAMPIIRYRTRDLTRLLPGTARSMRRMEKVTGRSDDMMIVRGVNVFPTQIEEELMKVGALAPHYQIVLDRAERLDTMQILVEASQPDVDRGTAAAELAQLVKSNVGVSVNVDVADPGGVERSLGKAKRIVDKRKL